MAEINEEIIKSILNLKDLDTDAIEKKVAGIQTILEGWASDVDQAGEAVNGLDTKTKTLFATIEGGEWVQAWGQALDKQLESAKAIGDINSKVEEQQFIRQKVTDQLREQLNTLIQSKKEANDAVSAAEEALGKTTQNTKAHEDAQKALARAKENATRVGNEAVEGEIRRLSVMVRQNEATQDLSDKTEDMIGTLTGIGDQWKNTFLGGIVESASAAEGFAGKISAIGQGLSEGFAKALTPMNLFMSGLQKIVEATVMMITKFDQATIGTRQFLGVGEEYDQRLLQTQSITREYNISLEEADGALRAVGSTMSTTALRTGEAADKLAAFVGPLSRIGIDAETGAQAMDTLIMTLGQTQDEAEATTHRLITFADTLGKPPKEMIKEFNAAMPKLAVHGTNAEKVFKGMQVAANATGVEMSKLLQVAEGFDTFEGASRKVGQLNAVLGGAFFNAMEMIEATDPGERIKLLMEGFQQTGKSFNELSYYQKKAIADAAGVSDMAEAERLFSGSADDAVAALEEKAAAQKKEAEAREKNEEMMKKNVEIQNKMLVIMEDLGKAFKPFYEILKSVIDILGMITKPIGEFLAGLNAIDGEATMIVGTLTGLVVAYKVLGGWLKSTALWTKISSFWTGIKAGSLGTNTAATITDTVATKGSAVAQLAQAKASKAAAFGFAAKAAAIGLVILAAAALVFAIAKLASVIKDMTVGDIAGLIVVLGVVGAGIYFLVPALVSAGAAAGMAAGPMLAFGGAVALMGVGIAIAIGSIALLVNQFKGMGADALGLALVVGVVMGGLYLLIPAIVGAGTVAAAASMPMLAMGAAVLMIGGAIAGIISVLSLLINSFTSLIEVAIPAIPQIVALSLAIFPLALGLAVAAPAAALLAVGLGLLAVGFGALALALAVIKTDDLVALGNIFQGMGNIKTENVGGLAGIIENIADELDELDIDKMDSFTEALLRMAAAASTLKAIGPLSVAFGASPREGLREEKLAGGPIGAVGGFAEAENKWLERIDARIATLNERLTKVKEGDKGGGEGPEAPVDYGAAERITTAAEAKEQARMITEATMTTRESTVSLKEILVPVMEKINATVGKGAPAAAAKIEMPEGVLVTRDVVVDLGREFDYRFKRQVKKIAEEYLEKAIKKK